MNNAEKFKQLFGIYATELWAMPKEKFLEWLNAEALEQEFNEWCPDCKEYDKENHCCHRFTKVIRQTVEECKRAYANEGWIPVTERLPSKEERMEWIDKNLGGVGYLYPCLVTRYSSINPDRTKNNPYVAKHYYDGEDFVNNGEEVCSEYIVAWRPLPEPYTEDES